ncbi:MAG: hypothetical protein AAF441_10020 [Pseudomonadota bacterium]
MTGPTHVAASPAVPRAFWLAFAANFVWINLSEVFRYFAFVMPMMREAFPGVSDVAPMSLPVFMIWGLWDAVLVLSATVLPWLFMDRFGASARVAIGAGTFVWLTVFVILWLGLYNMNLATPAIISVALPLAWLEMVLAAMIVRWAIRRESPERS